MNYRQNQTTNKQMDKTTRQTGLTSLLSKGNARGRPQNGSILNSSIHSNMRNGGQIATEANREMSVIMGSIESVVEDEEDIVIDSGGR